MKTETEIYVEAEMYAKTEKEKRLFGQRVSRCISTEEFQTEAYIAAFLKCQKEYEEKLRWIPVEEKLPENRERVLVKVLRSDKSTIIVTGSVVLDSKLGIYWQSGHSTQLNVTHWLSLSFL